MLSPAHHQPFPCLCLHVPMCPFRWPGGLGQHGGKGGKRQGAAAEAEGGEEEDDDDEDDAQDAMADVQGQQGGAPAHFGTLLSV